MQRAFIVALFFCAFTSEGLSWDLRKGCESLGTCQWVNNSENRFRIEFNRPFQEAQSCDLSKHQKKFKQEPCEKDMVWVCSEDYKVNVCVEKDLMKDTLGNPAGNFSRESCEQACRLKGRELPTNNEWLVAANGTRFENCDIHKPHPCVQEGFSQECLKRNFNHIPGSVKRPLCVSDFGLRDMVGVYGSWVAETHDGSGWQRARKYNQPPLRQGFFNGGLWPQKASTIFYQTKAHLTSYSDYSIGCRCAKPVGGPKFFALATSPESSL
jgi:hypothetical protein